MIKAGITLIITLWAPFVLAHILNWSFSAWWSFPFVMTSLFLFIAAVINLAIKLTAHFVNTINNNK